MEVILNSLYHMLQLAEEELFMVRPQVLAVAVVAEVEVMALALAEQVLQDKDLMAQQELAQEETQVVAVVESVQQVAQEAQAPEAMEDLEQICSPLLLWEAEAEVRRTLMGAMEALEAEALLDRVRVDQKTELREPQTRVVAEVQEVCEVFMQTAVQAEVEL